MTFIIPENIYLDDKFYNVIDVKNGGMGRVWLLESSSDDFDAIYKKQLAVKTFDFTPDHFQVDQELNAWVCLDHKNIVPLLRIGRLNYRTAAIMPWLKGTLGDALKNKKTLPEELALKIVIQIVEGLMFSYDEYKLVHLDLKPDNILFKSLNPIEIQISDWGISRIAAQITYANWKEIDSESQYTRYGAGTPLYMAPERFYEKWIITPQADMYSLGMIIIQIITGSLPFMLDIKNPLEEIIYGTYMENVNSLLHIRSKRFEKIIYSCINPNINIRPKNYKNLLSELKRC